MYNGIGLSTPRGSGTNGYVIRNLSFVKPPRQDNRDRQEDFKSLPQVKQANAAILDHDRKRKVEVKCMELSIRLEEEGLAEDVIEEKVQALRESLLADLEKMEPTDARNFKAYEVHQRAEAKEKDNAKMRNALKIHKEYVEGAAFDREVQERLKEERKARKEAEYQAREEKMERERYRQKQESGKRSRYSRSPTRRKYRSPSRSPVRSRRHRSPSRSPIRRNRKQRSPSVSSSSSASRSASRSPSRSPIRSRKHRSPSVSSRSSASRSPRRSRSYSSDSRGRSPVARHRHHRDDSSSSSRSRSFSSRSRSRST
ncbi:hypothetical protein BD560DRAFT_379392 [Blakeslea trispora]|nr:hypothetical protein BD560DRAFT_379392 [Blakeslea trispora]